MYFSGFQWSSSFRGYVTIVFVRLARGFYSTGRTTAVLGQKFTALEISGTMSRKQFLTKWDGFEYHTCTARLKRQNLIN